MSTRLVVLPGAGDEGGSGDLIDEGVGREKVASLRIVRIPLRRVVGVSLDFFEQVGVLSAKELIRQALHVAFSDSSDHPIGSNGIRPAILLLALPGPAQGKTVVEDSARVERPAKRVIDHRLGAD